MPQYLPEKITLWSLAGLTSLGLNTGDAAAASDISPVTNPQAGPEIACNWFQSTTRPMTTTLFINEKNMSIGYERHGGTLRPPAAEGCITTDEYMDQKAKNIARHFKHLMNFVIATQQTLPELHPAIDITDITQKRTAITHDDPQEFRDYLVDRYVQTGVAALDATMKAIEQTPYHLSEETRTDLINSRNEMVKDNLALNLALIQMNQLNTEDSDMMIRKQEHLQRIWKNASEETIHDNHAVSVNYQWFDNRVYRAPDLPKPK